MPALTRRALVRRGGLAAAVLLLGREAGSAPLKATEEAQLEAVRTFAAGWKENNPEKVVSPFAENCSVRWTAHKLEAAPFVGKADFLARVKGALNSQSIEMQVTDMFVLGPVVINCHHQLFERRTDKRQQEDLYIGVYFFEQGKIREWIDYAIFDPEARKPRAQGFDIFTHVTR